jgi:ElaB/YqjD/DUF883 family membrane-anchored ribosome-binding protein
MADNMADRGAKLGEKADDAMSTAKETASNYAGRAKEAVSQYAGKAKEYAQQGYEYASDKTVKAKDTAQGYIEDNPWYAVGIALGVGVLLGMLMRGGGRDD